MDTFRTAGQVSGKGFVFLRIAVTVSGLQTARGVLEDAEQLAESLTRDEVSH